MPALLAALHAFLQEHRRYGGLDSRVDGSWVWMSCDCGAELLGRVWPDDDSPVPRPPEPKLHRLVVCSCGWTREALCEWAAQSVSKRHRQLARRGVEHATRVEGPDEGGSGRQLTLTKRYTDAT